MNNFYYKVSSSYGKEIYCCFTAPIEYRAFRNLLFCMFSHLEGNSFKRVHPLANNRYEILYNKYAHKVEKTTKEIFEKEDEKQYD